MRWESVNASWLHSLALAAAVKGNVPPRRQCQCLAFSEVALAHHRGDCTELGAAHITYHPEPCQTLLTRSIQIRYRCWICDVMYCSVAVVLSFQFQVARQGWGVFSAVMTEVRELVNG